MISLLDPECVETKKWLTSDELMDVTVITESTQGPIAINCAAYTGYKFAGMKGAVSATIGIILPFSLLFLIISRFFENVPTVSIIAKAFRGIRIAVSVLIIQAAIKMIHKLIKKSPDKKTQIPIIVFFFVLILTLNIADMHISTVYLIIFSGIVGFILFGCPVIKRVWRDKK